MSPKRVKELDLYLGSGRAVRRKGGGAGSYPEVLGFR